MAGKGGKVQGGGLGLKVTKVSGQRTKGGGYSTGGGSGGTRQMGHGLTVTKASGKRKKD